MNRFVRPARVQWLPLLLVAAALIVGLFSVARKRVDSTEAAAPEALNVLLITVDTTRADRLHCYGYSAVETPNMDRLAAGGVQFTQCTSPVPATLPAHTSIMTGVYPYVHRVRINTAVAVDDANITLAEILKEKGYRTGALIASVVLNKAYRLNQGFDTYIDVPETPDESILPVEEGAESPAGPELSERTADQMADMTIGWLQRYGQQGKFFLWTHFYDPHYPHTPPEPYLSKYSHPYLGEIEFMDHHIGRILDELDRLNLTGRTLVVLAGDHGEGCGEHGEDGHIWFVYDSTLHVPLLFRLPNRLKPGTLVDAQVRLVDIAPTVLDLLGIDVPESINGASLVPLMDGKVQDLSLEAYAETLYPFESMRYAWLRSLRAGGWKYVHAPTPELYDLSADPGELKNVFTEHPEKGLEYRERLRDLIEEGPFLVTDDVRNAPGLTPEEQAHLAGIGYATGVGGELEAFQNEMKMFDPEGTDPKDRVDVIQKWTRALADAWDGDPALAEKALRELVEEEPGIAAIRLRLGTLLSKLGRFDEAREFLQGAWEISPTSAEINRNLGTVHHKLGDLPKALEFLSRAVELKQHDTAAWYERGAVLLDLNRPEEALHAFGVCDQLTGGRDSDIKYSLGTTLATLGRQDDAETLFEMALRINPTHSNAHYNLANSLARKGENEKALAHYQAALKSKPDFAQARINLSIVLSRLGRRDEAVEALYEAVRTDPSLEEGYVKLSQLLSALGRRKDAADVLTEALERHPGHGLFSVNLAALLVLSPDDELRDGERAVKVIDAALAAAGGRPPELLNWLAAAQAEAGRFDEAVTTAQEAAALAEAQNKAELLAEIRERLGKYEQGQTAR